MTIRSRVATDQYRENWDRVFAKKRFEPRTCDCPSVGGILVACAAMGGEAVDRCPAARTPLNPHDATEHPAAD